MKKEKTPANGLSNTHHTSSVCKNRGFLAPRNWGPPALEASAVTQPVGWMGIRMHLGRSMNHDESMNRCMESLKKLQRFSSRTVANIMRTETEVLYPWPLPVIRLRGLPCQNIVTSCSLWSNLLMYENSAAFCWKRSPATSEFHSHQNAIIAWGPVRWNQLRPQQSMPLDCKLSDFSYCNNILDSSLECQTDLPISTLERLTPLRTIRSLRLKDSVRLQVEFCRLGWLGLFFKHESKWI